MIGLQNVSILLAKDNTLKKLLTFIPADQQRKFEMQF
jgi:hypothetical protein